MVERCDPFRAVGNNDLLTELVVRCGPALSPKRRSWPLVADIAITCHDLSSGVKSPSELRADGTASTPEDPHKV